MSVNVELISRLSPICTRAYMPRNVVTVNVALMFDLSSICSRAHNFINSQMSISGGKTNYMLNLLRTGLYKRYFDDILIISETDNFINSQMSKRPRDEEPETKGDKKSISHRKQLVTEYVTPRFLARLGWDGTTYDSDYHHKRRTLTDIFTLFGDHLDKASNRTEWESIMRKWIGVTDDYWATVTDPLYEQYQTTSSPSDIFITLRPRPFSHVVSNIMAMFSHFKLEREIYLNKPKFV